MKTTTPRRTRTLAGIISKTLPVSASAKSALNSAELPGNGLIQSAMPKYTAPVAIVVTIGCNLQKITMMALMAPHTAPVAMTPATPNAVATPEPATR